MTFCTVSWSGHWEIHGFTHTNYLVCTLAFRDGLTSKESWGSGELNALSLTVRVGSTGINLGSLVSQLLPILWSVFWRLRSRSDSGLNVTKGPYILLYFGYFLFLVVYLYLDSVFFTYVCLNCHFPFHWIQVAFHNWEWAFPPELGTERRALHTSKRSTLNHAPSWELAVGIHTSLHFTTAQSWSCRAGLVRVREWPPGEDDTQETGFEIRSLMSVLCLVNIPTPSDLTVALLERISQNTIWKLPI